MVYRLCISSIFIRPQFIALYFEQPDHSGHSFGPNSLEVCTYVYLYVRTIQHKFLKSKILVVQQSFPYQIFLLATYIQLVWHQPQFHQYSICQIFLNANSSIFAVKKIALTYIQYVIWSVATLFKVAQVKVVILFNISVM